MAIGVEAIGAGGIRFDGREFAAGDRVSYATTTPAATSTPVSTLVDKCRHSPQNAIAPFHAASVRAKRIGLPSASRRTCRRKRRTASARGRIPAASPGSRGRSDQVAHLPVALAQETRCFAQGGVHGRSPRRGPIITPPVTVVVSTACQIQLSPASSNYDYS